MPHSSCWCWVMGSPPIQLSCMTRCIGTPHGRLWWDSIAADRLRILTVSQLPFHQQYTVWSPSRDTTVSIASPLNLYNSQWNYTTDIYNSQFSYTTHLYNSQYSFTTDLYNSQFNNTTGLYNSQCNYTTDLYNSQCNYTTNLYNSH